MIGRMRTRLVSSMVIGLVVLSVFAFQSAPAGQSTATAAPEARWGRAQDAWEAGDYPVALTELGALLGSPAAAEYLDRVALLTGEVFATTELTPDGRNPKISADGRFATFETGAAAQAVTRLVRVTPAVATIADLATTAVAFDPAGTRLAWLRGVPAAPTSEIVVRDLATGAEQVWLGAGLFKSSLAWSGDGLSVLFLGGDATDTTRTDVYAVRNGAAPVRLTAEPGFKANLLMHPRGAGLVFQSVNASPFGAGAGRGGGAAPAGGGAAATPPPPVAAGAGGAAPAPPQAAAGAGAAPQAGRAGGAPVGGAPAGGAGAGRGGAPASLTYTVVDLSAKTSRTIAGTALTMSADGSTLAWITRTADTYTLNRSPLLTDQITTVRTGRDRIEAPALSPDGSVVAYQLMTHTDWEIYLTDAAGAHRRLTRDIQHDVLPRFLTNGTLLGLMGEPRHRRAQLYDVATGARTRLFSNNSVRTISPEYVWGPSAAGQHLIVQADRDGDTISTERGVYVVDMSKKVSVADVRARIARQLADENDLRQRMTRAFKPVEAAARQTVARGAVNRVYAYQKALFDFDSKYISQPGNLKAVAYLEQMYRSFGYSPELQRFNPPQAGQAGTANVIAMKRGTENPELIYVVSSHFDSVTGGPGADDDTSGTAALLEAARMLADTPLPTTVVFASFTGEEAGLLGSREFVRLTAQAKWNVIGALNNDMIGWGGESSRMDNTIRYSNAGIKDIQHGAAFLFTNLVTYDAKYYRGTDANAFYDAWGDIVGGIGSYPVLANPNYHQPTDFLETMNHRQILETAKVTAATLVYLASSPSRLKDLKAEKTAAGVALTWTPSPEAGVKSYVVAHGPAADPLRTRVTVSGARATLPVLPAGTQISVKAVNARGLEGWDWARVVIQ
jgi:Tol biopolymer transport system component